MLPNYVVQYEDIGSEMWSGLDCAQFKQPRALCSFDSGNVILICTENISLKIKVYQINVSVSLH